jgi:predicted DNA-binding protein (MmcQ/YjbR family)
MDIATFRGLCLAKPGVTEETPFGPDVLVYKVLGKMFALADLPDFESANLKCDPERSADLRERYRGITPGYHMDKRHWNSVASRGDVPDRLLRELIDISYDLVRAGLPRKLRDTL